MTSVDIFAAMVVVVVCILLSAFFSGSETALTGASLAHMHAVEKDGDRRAALVSQLLRHRNRMMAALLFGNTLANIASSAVMTSVLVLLVGENGAVYATFIMTALLLIFAEVLPKTLAINHPDRASLAVARGVHLFVSIFGPLLAGVELLVRGLLKLVGVELGHGRTVLSPYDELMSAVDILHEEGNVERSARDMFGGVLDLTVMHVSDVMVHRTKMRAVDAELPPQQIIKEVLASPFTRMPLWRERPDNFIGVLHAKDLLRALDAAGGDASRLRVDDECEMRLALQERLQLILERRRLRREPGRQHDLVDLERRGVAAGGVERP